MKLAFGDAAFLGSLLILGINMVNMPKFIKILFMSWLITGPYHHQFQYQFLNYGVGIIAWILFIKCCKSFNVNLEDPFLNILFSFKDLRLKGYDPFKKAELKKDVKYLSTFSEILNLQFRYTTVFVALLQWHQIFRANLDYNNNIEEKSGLWYVFGKFHYALYYGIFISICIQNLVFVAAVLYVVLSKICFQLAEFSANKQLANFFTEIAYEVGDQRPYLLFDKPFIVKGVGSFWSDSWHTLLRDIFILVPKHVYKKASKKVRYLYALTAFISSGIFHDYLIIVTSQKLCLSSLTYFGIHGAAVIFEYFIFSFVHRSSFIAKSFGILFGYLILVSTCHFFVEPVKQLGIFDELYELYVISPMNLIKSK
eukprot:NODE_31_length_37178_cov_0.413576.p9 type:complete len:368 gc:universal NODE_31_length_37178_cov_0.413576:2718-1615(-)